MLETTLNVFLIIIALISFWFITIFTRSWKIGLALTFINTGLWFGILKLAGWIFSRLNS